MLSLYHLYGSTLLFTAIAVLYSLCPSFCRAQGNTTSSTSNPCETSGKCGAFGFCNSQKSPICSCLQGFYPQNDREWKSGNWSNGCERKVPLNCDGGEQDGFLRIQVMKLTGYEADRWLGPEIQCRARCLRNCSCLAYAFQVGIGCMFWSRALIDVQISANGSGSNLCVRVSNSDLEQKKDSKKIIIILVVVGFVITSICAYFLWKCIAKRRGKKKTSELEQVGAPPGSVDSSLQDAISEVNLQELPLFKFETLVNATNNFSEANEVGKGGFGAVYKGELATGREIAVKRLSQASGQGMQEFMNEVLVISRLQHRNLVRLLGCCAENKERMLIYEYMPNKSLDFFLFDPSQQILDWRKRFNIIEGIGRGLLYLHTDSRLKIIHRDLKPSNILLDNDWNPKISDFGMARIFGTRQDHVRTLRVVGTYGYMAPEYALKGMFSEKSDVFSFGVLMLEIATGRRNTSFIHQDDSLNLLGHVWKLWNEDSIVALIDTRISSFSYRAEVMRCIHIGLLCVHELPEDRPSISAVLSMLSSDIMELPEPKQPAFAIQSSHSHAGTSSSQQSQKSSSSMNNVSVTTIYGR